MIFHSSGSSGPGLLQDAVRDADLADVVHRRRVQQVVGLRSLMPAARPRMREKWLMRITCRPVSLSLYSAARPRRWTISRRVARSSSIRTSDRWVRTRARTIGGLTGLVM
jgi:hypothetical protein